MEFSAGGATGGGAKHDGDAHSLLSLRCLRVFPSAGARTVLVRRMAARANARIIERRRAEPAFCAFITKLEAQIATTARPDTSRSRNAAQQVPLASLPYNGQAAMWGKMRRENVE